MANTPTEIENLSDELSSNIQPPSLDEIRDLRYLVLFKLLTQQEIKMKMHHHNYVHSKSIVLVFVLI